ncbi:MAG: hypothetical protein LAE24_02215 [Candidatus Contendobacter sp.]|nr:hypothetical protein [Candidatus Contendobacter sp.]
MTTVAILPIFDVRGEKTYRAIAGNKQSVGKTAGQALDALTDQLEPPGFSGLLLIPDFQPDALFNAAQQQRLADLMNQWRAMRDRGEELPENQQTELEQLVEMELTAATGRSILLAQS